MCGSLLEKVMKDEVLLALLLFANGAFLVASTALSVVTDGVTVASVAAAQRAT